MDKPNVNKITEKLLHTDNSPVDQPKGTTRFVLNGVVETNSGDRKFIANEEANEACYQLPEGFIPIGKVGIGKGRTIILSVSSDESTSEIGIADDDCNYVTHVNDALSENKLNFKLSHQIDVIYRLRRGCEDTIYFVDGDNNKPRYYNFSKPDDFQTGGLWDARKFELIRGYESVPKFNNITVLNSGGQLTPGSYNVAIQYLDEDLNPTEWITTSPIIYIYNDDTDEDFLDIRGSINSETDYIDFPTTDKSIKIDLDNLDESFLFYRLAFIEATNGTGIVNNVKFSDNIPINKTFFIYTGNNFATEGTEEEIQTFTQVIDGAGHIEQVDNRLILSETIGKKVNFCKLQKYASRIKTDLRIKEVLVNQMVDGSPKNPTVNFEAAGYMPGEIYSFGIVYVFADGSTSPVYHIPGKNPNTDSNVIYTATDENILPMSNDNQSENNVYVDNSNCDGVEYWGVDAEGDPLNNQPVRHHRFPLRSELGLPLVEEVDTTLVDSTFWQVKLSGQGTIDICTQEEFDNGDCTPVSEPFQARVEFTVDGVAQAMVVNIDPTRESNPFSFEQNSEFFTSNNIVITGIYESTDPGTDITGVTSPKGLDYTAEVVEAEFTSEQKLYRTFVYGVQFSGVDIPTVDDTNGEEIIGYYIVRNDRTEAEKTVLDSAVMFPCLINNKYISHGLLGPEVDNVDRLSKNVFGLIHPEHKFHNYKYNEISDIIQEGGFDIVDRKYSKARYRDVLDGTSYDPSIHKSGGGKDEDGWSLKAITRDNITEYKKRYTFNKTDDDIERLFYLNALESRDINDDTNSVYNIAGDNRAGFLELKEDYDEDLRNRIPYVYLRRDIADSYSTFRTLPYYKASNNIEDTSVTSVFGGDTFITPMRYLNTVFWDNRIAERAGKTSVWNYIIGAILIVVGAILLIFTAGASTLVIGAGIAVIGGGALFIASGIKRDALVKAYNDEYDKGLRETALDNWVNGEYKNMTGTYEGGVRSADTPEDDEIQWIGDCVTDLWFESKVNTLVRNGFAVDTPTFMNAPGRIESGNDFIEPIYEHFDVYKLRDDLIAPLTVLDKHVMQKLTAFDPSRNDNRAYIGHPLGEYYNVNPDYERINRQKIYNHLALEYDCCSECKEEFPHRNHYSEQSFQEELTDNYRVFLPNNYRDIPGEKGRITNTYRLQNNFYVHTEEALWHLPQNFQERVTGDIISFLGTGSYFETPPRLITDADESSAGTKHKWSAHKSKNGILFASQDESKWYLFNGNELKPISEYGNSNWFREHMRSIVAEQYYASNGRPYPYLNNPSNPYGEGFISTYDSRKERLIVTKKDFSLIPELVNNDDYEICFNDGEITFFDGYEQTIADYEANGYEYLGIEDCRMKFSKVEYEEVEETRTVISTIPNEADIVIFYDTSGSFTESARQEIKDAVDDWLADFAAANPDWTGNLIHHETPPYFGERWLDCLNNVMSTYYAATDPATLDLIIVTFTNESHSAYHKGSFDGVVDAPYADYLTDEASFKSIYPQLKSFKGIAYPVVFTTGLQQDDTREYLKHVLAAFKGTSYSVAETDAIPVNPGFSTGDWNTLKSALQGANPYDDDGLENYGWKGVWNRYWDGTNSIINAEDFQEDINELLLGEITTEEVTVTVQVPVTTFEYVDGEVLEEDIIQSDNSWTMSFDLKEQSWVGWHSYTPNMYIFVAEKFYNWTYGNNSIFKHNKKGQYQTFNGQFYPHIIEYVSLSSPLITRIWDWLRFQTEAKEYIPAYDDFVDRRFITHNKMMVYNTRQHSGLLILTPKSDTEDADYLQNQIVNQNNNEIIIDREERDWHVNDFRDIRTDYDVPMFIKQLDSLQSEYFIDKIINDASLNVNKDWTQLESFRDKFLVVRFIFDNFDNIRLITNYSIEPESESMH